MLDSDSDNYNCKSIIKTSMILNNAWIINFACFEHFFYVRHIENLKPFSQIVFPQTTLVKSLYIIRKGIVFILSNLILILFSLKYNLLSVFQITKALLYVVIFELDFYVFKNIKMRKTSWY